MKPMSKTEEVSVSKIREVTGKKLQTCLFCLRCRNGNLDKAIQLCREHSDSEDGRKTYMAM